MTKQANQADQRGPSWLKTWWRIVDTKVGIIPAPVFVVLGVVLSCFAIQGNVPTEAAVMMAILAFLSFGLGEIGKHLPLFKFLGAPAIFATFIPSYLVYKHWLPAEIVKDVVGFTKSTNFLYLFISAIIVGSIFGMDRKILIQGFLRILIPISVGTVCAAAVGTGAGTLLGLGPKHSFFFVVLPIMCGGIGEGAIPLSVGYSDILKLPQAELFAQVLPPVMLGSLTAILFAGTLNYLGSKRPNLTGRGRLQLHERDDFAGLVSPETHLIDTADVAAAGITAITIYIVGLLAYRQLGWPAAVVMLFLTVILKVARVASPRLQQGAYAVYRIFAVGVTYPLLFAIGAALTPWESLVAALAVPNLITIAVTVTTMVATGFFTARWINLYPIDTAIVNLCRCGQGGTGDVAILTAAERMQLMPFAQVATRIGGGLTVIIALLLFAIYH